MATYKASNGKVVDESKMDNVADLSYEGCYGNVDSTLYRTRKSHQWYIISESSWCGEGNISGAEAISLKEATELVLEHDPDSIGDYPELAAYIPQVTDD